MPQEQTGQPNTNPAEGKTNGVSKPSRDDVIAGLAAMEHGKIEPKPDEKPATEIKPVEKPAPKEPDEEIDEDEDKPAEVEPEIDTSKDPDLAKRLAIVAKQEKRAKVSLELERSKAKAAIDQERLALKREQAEVQSARGEIEAFAKLKTRARYDAAGVLKSLGLGEDDLGPAARQLWALSKEGAADPKLTKDAAARLMQDREREDRITKLEREIAEGKRVEQERTQQAQVQKTVEAYLDGIKTAVTDEHPLAKRAVEKSPQKAMMRFNEIAWALSQRDGDLPDADEVLAEYERGRREELEADGVDIAAMLKPAKPKAKDEVGSRTIGNDLGTTTPTNKQGGAKKSQQEKRAELERDLRAMDNKKQ